MYVIFSIGPGNESINSFIGRLKKWNIECLVDLRSQPYSEYVPHFNRESLSSSVRRENIDYLYFGDRLGGRPPEGFEKFRGSPNFKENIDLLLRQIEGKSAALMCSEFDISKCHRRFIIVELIKRGIDVTVIDKEGNADTSAVTFSAKRSKRQEIAISNKNQSKLTGF
jgi:uncharacterized protein (DUF488 family)